MHAQKLRRLAMKMVSGNAPLELPKHVTHVVDADGGEPGAFTTIGAAIAFAQPFDRLLVRPGIYCERLKLVCASADRGRITMPRMGKASTPTELTVPP